MSEPNPVNDLALADRAIENLIARYARHVDDGDFAGVGALFACGVFIGQATRVSGRDAVEKFFHENLIRYADGTPRTQHLTTNVDIEIDAQAGTAQARSRVTVFQSLPDFPLQCIAAGRYADQFEHHNGQWCFAERHVTIHHAADLSRHLRVSVTR
ncbi:3-phenylpropionate/cinnamic acid dioxygenase small subunit [Streptomyces sp. SAI-144]|uniref:nuclear transport factor 2 family protein n=1 Tax=Streptomyces sp. SAI-144 TaxID=2940544 RepID=UPI002476A1CC|nr:nuclear transport factor 2 family protein [Streptomyces sp. SAI-144]MDH6440286.1 3-phenylpropionate/cinnamic acid dioxygenase small subunit [Streptomyces sp. SAI-144]